VPASTGEKEFGEWVIAPAALMSEEMYFLKPGKILHPDVKKHNVKSMVKTKIFIKDRFAWAMIDSITQC
jgi:hypothetical protein